MIRISPSSLSVFKECQRCYWFEQVQKVKRPRGIFPSLPGGIDRAMKQMVESSLSDGKQIVHLREVGPGDAVPYPDRAKIRAWQNWRTGLSVNMEIAGERVLIGGAIDELIVWPDGRVSPWDYKTKGSPPKEGDSERYYGHQLDIYHLLLQDGARLECTGMGYFTYGWPAQVEDFSIRFHWQTIHVATEPVRAVELITKAVEVIQMPQAPEPTPGCEYCEYVQNRTEVLS